MRAKMIGAFINFSVVFDNHEQLQDCLAILGLPCLGIFSIMLLRKPVPHEG